MFESEGWRETIIHGLKQFYYYLSDIYFYVVQYYGARDAMLIFFGVFGLISLLLTRAEMIRKTTGGMKILRNPAGQMFRKVTDGSARFVASMSLVLGFLSMAHFQGMF